MSSSRSGPVYGVHVVQPNVEKAGRKGIGRRNREKSGIRIITCTDYVISNPCNDPLTKYGPAIWTFPTAKLLAAEKRPWGARPQLAVGRIYRLQVSKEHSA